MQQRHIGIYDLRTHDIGAGGNSKETLALADHLSQHHQVTLMVQKLIDWRYLQNFFNIDLSRVRILILPSSQDAFLPGTTIAVDPDQTTHESHRRQILALDLDLFINKTYHSSFPCPIGRGIYTCLFPHPLPRLRRPVSLISPRAWIAAWRNADAQRKATYNAIDSYTVITANSGYTQTWIRRYWARDAKVVYSACESIGPSAAKQKWILHVGRFEEREGAGSHFKRQGVMIDAFKLLTDLHAAGWQLHLAGSVARSEQSTTYINTLQTAAAGYPIFFHFNAEQEALHTLYRNASLYWHATGYGTSPTSAPIAQEHFGITTVEAMSAGAVPVVIDSGGQRETVQHGVSGLRWKTIDELLTYTRQLANRPELWRNLSQQAMIASEQFSRQAYLRNMDQVIEEVMAA